MPSISDHPTVTLTDYEPRTDTFFEEVLHGLSRSPKSLPSKFFYDAHGSRLFDAICALDAYYPTRTEISIMETYAEAMAARLGPNVLLVEYGSGSSVKTERLLERLDNPAACVLIDISRAHLLEAAEGLARMFPHIEMLPVCADYTKPFEIPTPSAPAARQVAYYPGSTIGNFTPANAALFLEQIADQVGPGGGLLIGVDLVKDPAVLHAAYNDEDGITADFNLNLLHRINRELDGTFDPGAFYHYAPYNIRSNRVEMYLVSARAQTVQVGDWRFAFAEGESICTEYSCKYTVEDFRALASTAGFVPVDLWTDEHRQFSVHYFELASD